MPTINDSQRQQAVQTAQQSVFDPNFDPDVIMQEIANKDVMLQMKEQELAQREQALQQQAQQPPQQQEQPPQQEGDPQVTAQNFSPDDKLLQALQMLQGAILERHQLQAEEEQMQQQMNADAEAQQNAASVVPMKNKPVKEAPQPQQQQGPDVSPQTMQNVQPGQEVVVSKRIVMTPDGPMEVGRTEKIKATTQPAQQGQQQGQPQQKIGSLKLPHMYGGVPIASRAIADTTVHSPTKLKELLKRLSEAKKVVK